MSKRQRSSSEDSPSALEILSVRPSITSLSNSDLWLCYRSQSSEEVGVHWNNHIPWGKRVLTGPVSLPISQGLGIPISVYETCAYGWPISHTCLKRLPSWHFQPLSPSWWSVEMSPWAVCLQFVLRNAWKLFSYAGDAGARPRPRRQSSDHSLNFSKLVFHCALMKLP